MKMHDTDLYAQKIRYKACQANNSKKLLLNIGHFIILLSLHILGFVCYVKFDLSLSTLVFFQIIVLIVLIVAMTYGLNESNKLNCLPLLEDATIKELKKLLKDNSYKRWHEDIYRVIALAVFNDKSLKDSVFISGVLKGKKLEDYKKEVKDKEMIDLNEIKSIASLYILTNQNDSKTLMAVLA